MATEVAGALQRTAGSVEGWALSQGLNGAGASGALATRKEQQVPKGYLNYVLYDEDYRPIDKGYQRISEAAAVGKANATNQAEQLSLEVPIQQEGYLYTFLSNEPASNSSSSSVVHFDDFTVEQQSYIVDVQDYYPFGASFDQSAGRVLGNKYLYNGKELTNDFGLNVYDYQLRRYDPITGRWMSPDILANEYSSWSPYVYSLNNPIRFIDPDGAAPQDTNCPSCPTNDEFANALATDVLSVKHSLYNMLPRPFGYEATFTQNERGNYETGFVKANDDFLTAVGKYALDALSIGTFGRGGAATGGFLAKTPGKAALTNQTKNLFNASDELVSSLADKIEGAAPGRVQNVERIIKGSDGKIRTDFDIELDNAVIEVTRGGGKGKASQVLNKIQPETSKNVVVFGPNLKPSVQKELTNQGVQFFTKEEDLINFINQ